MTNLPEPPIDECRREFELFRKLKGEWMLANQRRALDSDFTEQAELVAWSKIWNQLWDHRTHPTPDRDGLIKKMEAKWQEENEVYKKTPSSYNEGWADGFEEAIKMVGADCGRDSSGMFIKASDWPGEPGHYHSPDPVLSSEISVLERSYVYMDVEFNEAQWKIVFDLLAPKAQAAEALSKAILEAHAKWQAQYQGIGHV